MANERTDYKTQWAELKADPVRYALHLEKRRQFYEKRKELERARSKAKYQRNKEYYLDKHREYYAANAEKWKTEYSPKRNAKRAENPEPDRERQREWYEQNKDYFAKRDKERRNGPDREKWLKAILRSAHRDRLSAERLEQVWEQSRNGPCEICGLTGEVMHLDHNHTTNTFRGILCDGCNRGIGFFKENLASLRKAIEYLETH